MKLNLQEQREIIRCRRWRQEFQEFFSNKRRQLTFDYKIATIPSFDQVDQLFNYLNDESIQQKSNKVYNFLANKPLVQDIMQKYFKSVDKYCLNIFMICARTIPQTGYEDIFAYAIGLSDSHENYHLIQGMKGLCKILHRQLPEETIQKLYNQDIVRNLFKILCQADPQIEKSARDYFMRKPVITLLKYLIQLNRFEKDRTLFNSKFLNILEQILMQVYRNLRDCLIFGPKNKSLSLILVIIRGQPALCDTITKEVRHFLRSLLIDKNASDQIIIEVLKILITVSSSKNESMAYLFYEENILNILWNFIDHVNLNIRDFIIHIFANYANSRHEGLKGELGSNRELLLRIIAEVKQQDEISQNLIYLLYGLLVNCEQYVDDEILDQQNFLSIFPYKLMKMEYTQYETESVILYIITTLLVGYKFRVTKEVKEYMRSFDSRKFIDEDVKMCLDNLYKIIN